MVFPGGKQQLSTPVPSPFPNYYAIPEENREMLLSLFLLSFVTAAEQKRSFDSGAAPNSSGGGRRINPAPATAGVCFGFCPASARATDVMSWRREGVTKLLPPAVHADCCFSFSSPASRTFPIRFFSPSTPPAN
jgi:hypothetical protein